MLDGEFGGQLHHLDECLATPPKLCRCHIRLTPWTSDGFKTNASDGKEPAERRNRWLLSSGLVRRQRWL